MEWYLEKQGGPRLYTAGTTERNWQMRNRNNRSKPTNPTAIVNRTYSVTLKHDGNSPGSSSNAGRRQQARRRNNGKKRCRQRTDPGFLGTRMRRHKENRNCRRSRGKKKGADLRSSSLARRAGEAPRRDDAKWGEPGQRDGGVTSDAEGTLVAFRHDTRQETPNTCKANRLYSLGRTKRAKMDLHQRAKNQTMHALGQLLSDQDNKEANRKGQQIWPSIVGLLSEGRPRSMRTRKHKPTWRRVRSLRQHVAEPIRADTRCFHARQNAVRTRKPQAISFRLCVIHCGVICTVLGSF